MARFLMIARWGQRFESRAGCALRLATFLDRLQLLDPALCNWQVPDDPDNGLSSDEALRGDLAAALRPNRRDIGWVGHC